jgi:hypothetical protein
VSLADAAHVVGLGFATIRFFVPHLPFNPVELVEELERLRRRAAEFLPRLESVDKTPPGVGHTPDMRGALQRAPGRVAITHQDAAVVAKEGLLPRDNHNENRIASPENVPERVGRCLIRMLPEQGHLVN